MDWVVLGECVFVCSAGSIGFDFGNGIQCIYVYIHLFSLTLFILLKCLKKTWEHLLGAPPPSSNHDNPEINISSRDWVIEKLNVTISVGLAAAAPNQSWQRRFMERHTTGIYIYEINELCCVIARAMPRIIPTQKQQLHTENNYLEPPT